MHKPHPEERLWAEWRRRIFEPGHLKNVEAFGVKGHAEHDWVGCASLVGQANNLLGRLRVCNNLVAFNCDPAATVAVKFLGKLLADCRLLD